MWAQWLYLIWGVLYFGGGLYVLLAALVSVWRDTAPDCLPSLDLKRSLGDANQLAVETGGAGRLELLATGPDVARTAALAGSAQWVRNQRRGAERARAIRTSDGRDDVPGTARYVPQGDGRISHQRASYGEAPDTTDTETITPIPADLEMTKSRLITTTMAERNTLRGLLDVMKGGEHASWHLSELDVTTLISVLDEVVNGPDAKACVCA
jgi:hypothetical protein